MRTKKILLTLSAIVIVVISVLILLYTFETRGWDSPLITDSKYTPTFQPKTKNGSEISEIRLQRHGCYGACPVYTVIFNKDGSAKYDGSLNYFGRANGYKIGTYYGETKEFDSLAAWIKEHDVERIYQDCPQGAEDTEVVSLTVVIRGRTKAITVCDSSKAPEQLLAIYKAIDDASSRIVWHKQQAMQ